MEREDLVTVRYVKSFSVFKCLPLLFMCNGLKRVFSEVFLFLFARKEPKWDKNARDTMRYSFLFEFC